MPHDIERDLQDIVELMVEYQAQLPAGLYPDSDPAYVFDQLAEMHADGSLLYVIERDGPRAVGCLVLSLFPAFWSPAHLGASDMIFYVRPDHRGGTGLRLIAEAERKAKAAGVTMIEMNNVSPEHFARVDRLYRRLGYRQTCTTYEKGL